MALASQHIWLPDNISEIFTCRRYNRGLVYIRLNQADHPPGVTYLTEALNDLSEVLEKSAREYADAYTRRGEVYTLQGKWKEAQQDFHSGCRLNQEESCARRESL